MLGALLTKLHRQFLHIIKPFTELSNKFIIDFVLVSGHWNLQELTRHIHQKIIQSVNLIIIVFGKILTNFSCSLETADLKKSRNFLQIN